MGIKYYYSKPTQVRMVPCFADAEGNIIGEAGNSVFVKWIPRVVICSILDGNKVVDSGKCSLYTSLIGCGIDVCNNIIVSGKEREGGYSLENGILVYSKFSCCRIGNECVNIAVVKIANLYNHHAVAFVGITPAVNDSSTALAVDSIGALVKVKFEIAVSACAEIADGESISKGTHRRVALEESL